MGTGLEKENGGMNQPMYSGPNRSGVCKCGHSWEDHHLCVVMNQEYFEQTGEEYVPCECEYYGCNETGGMDSDGKLHCSKYTDSKL
jgi:hypothetical protein